MPQIPQWVTRISMSVDVKGLGVKVVNVKGSLALWATQPWKVLAGGVEGEVMVSCCGGEGCAEKVRMLSWYWE